MSIREQVIAEKRPSFPFFNSDLEETRINREEWEATPVDSVCRAWQNTMRDINQNRANPKKISSASLDLDETSLNLATRVEKAAGIIPGPSEDEIEAIAGQCIDQAGLPEESKSDMNFMVALKTLIGDLLWSIHESSRNDQRQLRELEKEFKDLTGETADLQTRSGQTAFIVSLLTLGASLFQAAPNAFDQAVAKGLTEVFPGLGKLLDSTYQSRVGVTSNHANLNLQKHNNSVTKGQGNSQKTQELHQLAKEWGQMLQAAARA